MNLSVVFTLFIVTSAALNKQNVLAVFRKFLVQTAQSIFAEIKLLGIAISEIV